MNLRQYVVHEFPPVFQHCVNLSSTVPCQSANAEHSRARVVSWSSDLLIKLGHE